MPSRIQLWDMLEPVLSNLGYELIQVEVRPSKYQSLLRLYIDAPEGINLEDCELASRQVSSVLDVEDPFTGPYTLEVSSPGLDRPLVKPEHFARFIGNKAQLRLGVPLEGRRNFVGILRGISEGSVALEVDGQLIDLPWVQVESAHLVPEI
jgi:ribosome maturation factor RimP